jgi:glycosyltransferase involved in cell wall biosynthesis
MRVLIATDAWRPQINGVVRSLEYMAAEAPRFGAEVVFLTPERFRSVPMPTYPEIRLSLVMPGSLAGILEETRPTHVHIAKIPEAWCYQALKRFHRAARAMMVSTPSLERELTGRGFENIMRWTRGVDTALFRPRNERILDAAAPVFLYVGRVAVEKNLDAFLSLDLPGTKVVVGDGPSRVELGRRYPEARFLGALTGEDLARVYASSDVFVFPSLTDTFGIVLIEALASGLPIAAFPVTGPLDVIGASGCGVLDADLRVAALAALDIPRDRCRAYGETFTWHESARQFFSNIEKAHSGR